MFCCSEHFGLNTTPLDFRQRANEWNWMWKGKVGAEIDASERQSKCGGNGVYSALSGEVAKLAWMKRAPEGEGVLNGYGTSERIAGRTREGGRRIGGDKGEDHTSRHANGSTGENFRPLTQYTSHPNSIGSLFPARVCVCERDLIYPSSCAVRRCVHKGFGRVEGEVWAVGWIWKAVPG